MTDYKQVFLIKSEVTLQWKGNYFSSNLANDSYILSKTQKTCHLVMQSQGLINASNKSRQEHLPFTVSETEPVMEAGEFVALDWGAEEAGSSTITSISLLLSSGGIEPICNSLLMDI